MSASIQGDVASAIGQQVEQMILQAKKDSEARVRHDLSVARTQLQTMEGHVLEMEQRLVRCVRTSGGNADVSQTVDRKFLSQKVAQLEAKWGSEVKALKQDLHRTILAHNHNSDLMRHHRDALDDARRNLDLQMPPKAEQVETQFEKVDRMLRTGQAKQRALDALTERLTALEQQVTTLLPAASDLPSGFPASMFPGGGVGLPGAFGAPGAAARAEQPKKKKDGELPTEDEVRQKFLQAAAVTNKAGDAHNFNAEAPVFVPRGAATQPEAAAAAAPAESGSAEQPPAANTASANPSPTGVGSPPSGTPPVPPGMAPAPPPEIAAAVAAAAAAAFAGAAAEGAPCAEAVLDAATAAAVESAPAVPIPAAAETAVPVTGSAAVEAEPAGVAAALPPAEKDDTAAVAEDQAGDIETPLMYHDPNIVDC